MDSTDQFDDLDINNFCYISEEIESFVNDSETLDSRKGFEAECNLYSFTLPNERVELSFSKLHPVQTIVNGLKNLRNGFGCLSWYNEIVIQRHDFDSEQIHLIITCLSYSTGMLAKFAVLDKICNAANVRRPIPRDLVSDDDDAYLLMRLRATNAKIKN